MTRCAVSGPGGLPGGVGLSDLMAMTAELVAAIGEAGSANRAPVAGEDSADAELAGRFVRLLGEAVHAVAACVELVPCVDWTGAHFSSPPFG